MNATRKHTAKRRKLRRALIATGIVTVLVAGGGAAWAVDRFLIEKVEIANVSEYEAAQNAESGTDTIRLKQLANLFLQFKHQRVQSGELSPRTHGQYVQLLARLVKLLGADCDASAVRPTDWQLLRATRARGGGAAQGRGGAKLTLRHAEGGGGAGSGAVARRDGANGREQRHAGPGAKAAAMA